MKHLTLVVLLSLLLSACESGFDRCMATELPRANAIDFGRSSARELLVDLKSALTQSEISLIANRQIFDWDKENPEPVQFPAFPEQLDYENLSPWEFKEAVKKNEAAREKWAERADEWRELPEIQKWSEQRRNAKLSIFNEAGLQITSDESLSDLSNTDWLDDLLMPRALRNACWGAEQEYCERLVFVELLATDEKYSKELMNDKLSDDDVSHFELAIKALSESIAWQSNELRRLEGMVLETATRACNSNGFYE